MAIGQRLKKQGRRDHRRGFRFGEGMARRFAEEGARVVVADLNARGAERVAEEIGGGAIAVTTDVSSAPRSGRWFRPRSALRAHRRAVNNAGYTHRNGDLLGVDEDVFDPHHCRQHEGHLSGDAGIVPVNGKAGRRLDHHHRLDGGPQAPAGPDLVQRLERLGDHGHQVDGGGAGAQEHPRQLPLPRGGRDGHAGKFMGADTPEIRERFKASIPLGRLSTPLDIANAALWLASDEANSSPASRSRWMAAAASEPCRAFPEALPPPDRLPQRHRNVSILPEALLAG